MCANASTTVCVTTADELQQALTNAESATSTTFIDMARGTYLTASLPDKMFEYFGPNQQLDLAGGFNSDCSERIEDPRLTIIDGGGSNGILELQSIGGISVRWITFQNGVGVSLTSQSGQIIANYNIFRALGTVDSPFYILISETTSTNSISMWGNLIYGNSTLSNQGTGQISNAGSGPIYFTNNTVANNAVGTGSGSIGGIVFTAVTATYLTNNILWNNTVGSIDAKISGPSFITTNDIGILSVDTAPTVDGGFAFDPQFTGPSDFHLLASSPLLQQGRLTPANGLPTIDIEGNPRTFANAVDLGAYERGDYIFDNDFDH
jgi:hypothetical protein